MTAAATPEKTSIKLGFIPLTDCAPLVVAKAHGYFSEEGLDVTLCREASWASIRDKVILGELDGAHMLAPMPLAATLGVAGPRVPLLTACVLSLNGNAITVSHELYERMNALAPDLLAKRPVSALALKRVLEHDGRRLRFATVFPISSHNYQLRYWLAAAGIDPDRDLDLRVIPPPRMVEAMESGEISGYCVGEPWNTLAAVSGVGRCLISSYEIWSNSPEKVLGVTEDWAMLYPITHQAMVRALLRACAWIESHRLGTAALLADARYLDMPPELIAEALTRGVKLEASHAANPDFLVFNRYAANFPWHSQGLWFGQQMRRWGQLGTVQGLLSAVQRAYRVDLYRSAALSLGQPVPLVDHKAEGRHFSEWTLESASRPIAMGPDAFADGGVLAVPQST